jgi:hypothetical protein
MQVSSQVTKALHALSLMQVVPALVTHAGGVAIVSWVMRHEVHAALGVPLGQAEAQSLAQGEPEAQPQSARA